LAYRYGNRNQVDMFPPSIEDYITHDDPVSPRARATQGRN